ncbi:hypothetical protein OIU85_005963 [Salix viminalis]|uniref:Sulfhydryl oxidase n=1 Tax=Salix viminalis TaxID=40686 RepID=A0A9Q0PK00_SALVM|nr:hypothetical protein OIU85_005963 [Salix viminalis]
MFCRGSKNDTRGFSCGLWVVLHSLSVRIEDGESQFAFTAELVTPIFPKIIWPPKELCSSCHPSSNQRENGAGQIDWNLNEVYKFLTGYYGKTLASLYKEKDRRLGEEVSDGAIADLVTSTSAVVVPVGAALAIALASCAFGALACFWRSQQKNRKYYHQLHSLKNI